MGLGLASWRNDRPVETSAAICIRVSQFRDLSLLLEVITQFYAERHLVAFSPCRLPEPLQPVLSSPPPSEAPLEILPETTDGAFSRAGLGVGELS
nr:hypothetical protein Itr_chr11CG04200 [Ipomoea trifida]